ncbi:MAG: HAMP domain-containing histidine kinase [Defluviitaleaceae bacterium]|nr:HAMP domain-containing histidine kinase [Defluviitaleaceae bacterium]
MDVVDLVLIFGVGAAVFLVVVVILVIRRVLKFVGRLVSENADLARDLEDVSLRLDEAGMEIRRLESKNVALDALSRSKTEFLSNISHEFRTPLTIISGYAQIAQQRMMQGTIREQEIKNMQTIFLESRRLSALVKTLLEVYVIKERVSSDDSAAVEDAVNSAAAACKPILDKNGNRLLIEILPECQFVAISREMILQALVNLVANANRRVKNATITLSAQPRENMILFGVHDAGGAISPELIDELFSHEPSRDNGPALSISKEIIEAYGGKIDIVSNDKGNCLSFTLPIYNENTNEVKRL